MKLFGDVKLDMVPIKMGWELGIGFYGDDFDWLLSVSLIWWRVTIHTYNKVYF